MACTLILLAGAPAHAETFNHPAGIYSFAIPNGWMAIDGALAEGLLAMGLDVIEYGDAGYVDWSGGGRPEGAVVMLFEIERADGLFRNNINISVMDLGQDFSADDILLQGDGFVGYMRAMFEGYTTTAPITKISAGTREMVMLGGEYELDGRKLAVRQVVFCQGGILHTIMLTARADQLAGCQPVLAEVITSMQSREEDPHTASSQEIKTIKVSTAGELVNAIASNTTILLSDGVYNLSQAYQGGDFSDEAYWDEVEDGVELIIEGVRNLTIRGESPGCQVVVEPRNAAVLSFYGCAGITIENITAGHTLQSDACEGGVFYFEDCADIQLINAHMFGCGTYGLYFQDVSDAKVIDSSIFSCTTKIMTMAFCRDISFANCVFRDTEGEVLFDDVENVTMDGCQFINLEAYALFYGWDSTGIVVKNSSFIHNTADYLDWSGLVLFQGNTFTGNSFSDNGNGSAAAVSDGKPGDIVGLWRLSAMETGRMTLDPAAAGYEIAMAFHGDYTATVLLSGREADEPGTWAIREGRIVLYANESGGEMVFTLDDGTLVMEENGTRLVFERTK